jgi:hypothetical protein
MVATANRKQANTWDFGAWGCLPFSHSMQRVNEKARKCATQRRNSEQVLCPAGSNGRGTTIWYIAVFKGGVYEARETVWVFDGGENHRVASLEGRADAA